jgi:regulator of sigma E protease
LRFSVGFGMPLLRWHDRRGTEFVIAAIPLGGYVKMLDEREGDVAPRDLEQAFNRKSVGRRIAIVAAGPFANLLLCVALLWAMFVIGRPDYAPVVGHVEGLAAQSQLSRGDTLLAIGGRATPTWSEAAMALATAAMDRSDVPVRVRTDAGQDAVRMLRLSQLPAGFDEQHALQDIGLTPRHQLLPPTVGTIAADSPAWGVLAEGDRITAIDGAPVPAFEDIGPMVQRVGGHAAMVEVQRDGERLALEITPQRRKDATRAGFWALGVTPAAAPTPAYDARLQFGPVAAIPAALRETWKLGTDSVEMIGRLLNGRASAGNVSGPITIARYANASAQLGPAWFLNFLALMSLSLAIVNILPIPVLDGGHLLYYLIELAKGSPLSERAMAAGQYVGLGLLAGLMGLAFYNDILQLLH